MSTRKTIPVLINLGDGRTIFASFGIDKIFILKYPFIHKGIYLMEGYLITWCEIEMNYPKAIIAMHNSDKTFFINDTSALLLYGFKKIIYNEY